MSFLDIVTESESIRVDLDVFVGVRRRFVEVRVVVEYRNNSFGDSGQRKRAREYEKREAKASPLSNYPSTCKCTSSRSGKEVAD